MEMGFQALLLEGEYPLSPALDQNGAVYYPTYPAYLPKTEPNCFDFLQLPDLRSLEQLPYDDVAAAKRVRISPNERGKKRRHSISEKIRSLQKLLPCDRKMDTSTMLEETHKYVKFLQAQVSALQSMPLLDPTNQVSYSADMYGARLGRLSRQQLLEVVLNSNMAQHVLYTRGCCVYSAEQLALLQRVVAEKKALSQFLSLYYF